MAQTGVSSYSNPLRKFKLVFLGEQSGRSIDVQGCDEGANPSMLCSRQDISHH